MSFIQALINGLLLGGVYGVISSGLSLVFGVLGIVNFAHAEFMMFGMYVAWFAWRIFGIDPLIGSIVAAVIVGAIGFLVQRCLLQHVLKGPPAAQISLTVGLMIFMENAALVAFGSDFRTVVTPYQTAGIEIGQLYIQAPYLLAFIAAISISVILWLYLSKSWTGRAIRATSQDPMAAKVVGVDTQRIYGMTFALGVGLTAMGGAVILPYLSVSPSAGGQFAVLMFTVVVLGGLGSVAGALAGGIIVGIVQSVSALMFPTHLQNLILFIIFIAVLAFRPQGLLKER
jgi:branched-chain amino acid transport system permease protein